MIQILYIHTEICYYHNFLFRPFRGEHENENKTFVDSLPLKNSLSINSNSNLMIVNKFTEY